MKRLLLSILMTGFVYAGQSQEINDWENPQVIGINKEPYHANLTLPSQKYNCGECESLDGSWKFRWYARPEQRIVEFYQPDFDSKRRGPSAKRPSMYRAKRATL